MDSLTFRCLVVLIAESLSRSLQGSAVNHDFSPGFERIMKRMKLMSTKRH